MMSMRRVVAPRRGQSLVESALILPIMIAMCMGVLDAGFTFFAYVQVINSSREGARAASQYRYLYQSPSNPSTTYTSGQNDTNRAYGNTAMGADNYTDNAKAVALRSLGTLKTAPATVSVVYSSVSAPVTNLSRSMESVKVEVTYHYDLPFTSSLGFPVAAIDLKSSTTAMIRGNGTARWTP